jgi:hypothetical protein
VGVEEQEAAVGLRDLRTVVFVIGGEALHDDSAITRQQAAARHWRS